MKIELVGEDLSGDVPAALGGLTALKSLVLNGNQMTSVPAALGVGRCRLTTV